MWLRLERFLSKTNAATIKHQIALRDYGKADVNNQHRLIYSIRRRLRSEDYTCRLPRIKPRYRVKLRRAVTWRGQVYIGMHPRRVG